MPSRFVNTKIRSRFLPILLLIICSCSNLTNFAQQNLLLNGGFEDINTCTEYNSECGVEAWFYMKDIKAQMLSNDDNLPSLGNNSFAIFFPWGGRPDFSPVLGTILPCRLQKGNSYSFRGMIQAKLNNRLILKPGVALGEKYFVPRRPFASGMHADTILQITKIPKSDFFQFEYSFVATGAERYLTFGTFTAEDTTGAKRAFIGNQSITIILDNFELVSTTGTEIPCSDFSINKENIYHFDSRHKTMDYALYGKGELPIVFAGNDSSSVTRASPPEADEPVVKADTLKLGDVFFDFNKALLKPSAVTMLEAYFKKDKSAISSIDSVYVDGHTDSIGTESKNLVLSGQRCKALEEWLVSNGIVGNEHVIIRPFGKTRPVASNSTAAGRAMNRRVEIIVFRKIKN